MSVNPGFGGQAFIPATLDRLPLMRELADVRAEPVAVEVDGGVGPATIADVHRAGANVMVAGSAIFSTPAPADAYRELVTLAAGHTRV
jgi:ribulose-phosphate 3-epimerase